MLELRNLPPEQQAEIDAIRAETSVTSRLSVPALESLMYQPYAALDHGFVRVVDYHGGDTSVTQSARVSYGRGTKTVSDDRSLIRYLISHWHSTPFEHAGITLHVKLPIFVARQWIRHRTACLTGDTQVTFDLPSKVERSRRQSYKLSVSEIYERFQPTRNESRPDKQRNPYYRRDRLKEMLLRSCNEETGEPYHTRISDIWQTGVKPVVRVQFSNGAILRATRDHLCLTSEGWLKLGDALDRNALFACFRRRQALAPEMPMFSNDEIKTEEWRAIPTWSGYEASSLGRIRSWKRGRGVLDEPAIKGQTVTPAGYAVVSVSEGGISRAKFVHHLVAEAFRLPRGKGEETRHRDNNSLNNRISNMLFGSKADNAKDRMETGCDQTLGIVYEPAESWSDDGEEMTYDISVTGPHHNFSAAGVVVHNSVNEYSARYSVLDREFYLPRAADLAQQSTINNQGRGLSLNEAQAEQVLRLLRTDAMVAYDDYEEMIDPDGPNLARELARINLPVSFYTQWYWKIDAHNLMSFLRLRADSHAQMEIRVYAEIIQEIFRQWMPLTAEAFQDYRQNSYNLSSKAVDVVRKLLAGEDVNPASAGLSKREWRELMEKLGRPV